MRERLAFANGSRSLADIDPGSRPGAPKKSALKSKLADGAGSIADLQEKLWAEATAGGSRRVLLLLQGIDTAGKGGTTEHVIGECGPIGVQYTAFGKPTKEELRHDFLWRIKKHVPPPGVIGIFDRSHYEDVLIVRVHDLVPPEEWEQRYDKINAFERDLVAHGTTVLKVFLHISYERQRKRLLRRLERPDKHWKFNVADLDERALVAEVPGGVPGDARALRYRGRTVVRRAVRLEEVPQLGRRPARARDAGVPRSAIPAARSRRPRAEGAPARLSGRGGRPGSRRADRPARPTLRRDGPR